MAKFRMAREQYSRRLLARETFELWQNGTRQLLAQPGIAKWWETMGRQSFEADFVQYVDQITCSSPTKSPTAQQSDEADVE